MHAVRFELTRVAPLDLESNALDRSAIHASSGFSLTSFLFSLTLIYINEALISLNSHPRRRRTGFPFPRLRARPLAWAPQLLLSWRLLPKVLQQWGRRRALQTQNWPVALLHFFPWVLWRSFLASMSRPRCCWPGWPSWCYLPRYNFC